MSASVPSRHSILTLYAATLRSARSFSSYNFREYFLRRAKTNFREIQRESDPSRVQNLVSEAARELTVLRRSAVVNQLFGGWRLAVEEDGAGGRTASRRTRTRGDN